MKNFNILKLELKKKLKGIVVNRTDPSQNFIDRYAHPLDALFLPKTVAVVGAKDDPGSVSKTILTNLIQGSFAGKIFPINPKRNEVLGLTCYPSLSSIGKEIDLAIIVTPAHTVPAIIEECVSAKVKSVIIISAGFKELGEAGIKLEEEILKHAQKGNMPIIGPNCLGVMNPIYGLNATFAKGMALPGNLAFISQSGAMCTAILDWSFKEKIGFSSFVSIGSMVDVNWGTLIDYLGDDPNTHSLLLYMETVGDVRSFLTAAREVALEKPIIIIKPGRSEAAAKAAASHTGSLAGSDDVFDAALERVGVLRVNTIAELFGMASVLSRQPLPKGPNLSIVTNAGGPAVLATDAATLNRAELTPMNVVLEKELNDYLPPAWSHSNPIDILGDADVTRYENTLKVLAKDPQLDGLLVILSPQDMTDPQKTAEGVAEFSKTFKKTLLASWMGGDFVQKGIDVLNQEKIPVFEYPDDAAKTFGAMWQYSQNLQNLYETPTFSEDVSLDEKNELLEKRKKAVATLLKEVSKNGRTLLTEYESKLLLQIYDIPVVITYQASTKEEAVELAQKIGFPVVVKLSSKTITHKSDIGGVKLNLKTSNEVSNAFDDINKAVLDLAGGNHFEGVTVQKMVKTNGYELILGCSTDPQFGPVLLFGLGGQLVEVFKDSSLGFPPLNKLLAKKMMAKTSIYEALLGVRGKAAVDMEILEETLVKFSRMIIENPRILECDINPLIASESGVIALDARFVLHGWAIEDKDLPQLAIRAYPSQYVENFRLQDGSNIVLRPIRPEDEPLLVQFHKELSEKSIRQRFFAFMSLSERVAHDRLIRICFTDYDRDISLVAEKTTVENKEIIGVARLGRVPGTQHAQVKLIIADAYHNLGLGTKLIKNLLEIAKKEKIDQVDVHILAENEGMIKICHKLGFVNIDNKDSGIIQLRFYV